MHDAQTRQARRTVDALNTVSRDTDRELGEYRITRKDISINEGRDDLIDVTFKNLHESDVKKLINILSNAPSTHLCCFGGDEVIEGTCSAVESDDTI